MMSPRALLAFAVLTLVLAADAALAQAYKYRDARGRVHYTDNLYEVPENQREAVETVEMPAAPLTPEELEAQSDPRVIATSAFENGVRAGLGRELDGEGQKTLREWAQRWLIPYVGTAIVSALVALGLTIHAFANGHPVWGVLQITLLGLPSGVYAVLHPEQSLPARLGLLVLWLSPALVSIASLAQLTQQIQPIR